MLKKNKKQTQKPTTYIIYHFERLIPIDTVYLCIYMLTEACKKTDLQIYAYKDCCPHAWQSIFHLVPIPGDHLRISNSTAPKEPKEGIPIPFKGFCDLGSILRKSECLKGTETNT